MINEETIIFTMILVVLVSIIPRKYFLLPFVIAVCFIPFDQRIIILRLDFTPLRLLVVFGVLRTFLRGEQREIRWNLFDKMIFAWAICGAIVYVIQWGDIRAFVYRSGILFDIIGLYWLFRQNIHSWDEVGVIAMFLAICAMISATLVLVERVTEHNPFTLLGNVRTGAHRGRYRCRGSFEHSITLGLFWVNLVPIFVAYAIRNRSKALFWWLATAACVTIVIMSASSTPIIALLWILFLLPMFHIRRYGKQITLGIFGIILALHIVMNKPVWHLICRVRLIPGSTGYHRFLLINSAIEHFDEWALLGTRSTSHWGHAMYDITNYYIRQGLDSGFVTLVFLIIVLILATRICGKYSLLGISRAEQWLGWAFCVSVLGHCMSFFGVSYFGKLPMLLYLTYAVASMMNDKQKTAMKTQFVSNVRYHQKPFMGKYL